MPRTPVAASPRIDWVDLPPHVRGAVEDALGGRVMAAVTQSGGFSPGTAARVEVDGGRRAFVKAVAPSLNPDTPELHRREARALALLPEEVPAPRLLAAYATATGWPWSWRTSTVGTPTCHGRGLT